MKISVKDKDTGKIYTNDMSNDGEGILEIHFSTSYTQVIVQDVIETDEKTTYPKKDLILPPLNGEESWVDMIATQNDSQGEWI